MVQLGDVMDRGDNEIGEEGQGRVGWDKCRARARSSSDAMVVQLGDVMDRGDNEIGEEGQVRVGWENAGPERGAVGMRRWCSWGM